MPKDSFSLPEGLPQKINSAKSFLVVLPQNLTVDNAAAALSLFLSLKKKKDRVKIGSPSPVTVEFNRLFGIDKISQKIGTRNLIISFPENSVEKVSSQIIGDKLNLIIQPKAGCESIDPEKLEYNHSGADADIIFIIGAQKIEDLGMFYEKEKKVFDEKETINIDVTPGNTKFGKINLILPEQIALSQIIAALIKRLNLPIDQDIATNLIAGIEGATNHFQLGATAETFETVAWCLHQGGKQGYLRVQGVQQAKSPFMLSPKQEVQPPFQKPQFAPASTMTPIQSEGPTTPQPLFTPPQANQPQMEGVQPQVSPPFVQQVQNNTGQPIGNSGSPQEKAPAPDWFKPKIFSASGTRKG